MGVGVVLPTPGHPQPDHDRGQVASDDERPPLDELRRALDAGELGLEGFQTALRLGGAALVVVLAIGAWLYNTRRAHALTQADTIVLANFTNKTGDSVFDETLRQGLAAQLQQSPFLSLISEQRIQQELRLMGVPADSKLSPKMAGDLCQRLGSKVYLGGSISNIGNQYVVGVNAVNCQTGDSVAQEQVTANGKEGVLGALGTASTKLRLRRWRSTASNLRWSTANPSPLRS